MIYNIYKSKTSEERNFIKQIKAPIFLQAVLELEATKPQSNLEETDNPGNVTRMEKVEFFWY